MKILFLLSLLVLVSCGKTKGKAVTSPSVGASPFPVVKANCGNQACI